MNCPQCGSALEAGVKFCANCGTKVHTEAESAAAVAAEPAKQEQAPASQPVQPVQYVSTGNHQDQTSAGSDIKMKRIASDYFTFLWDSLKAPGLTASTIDASHKLYGLLTMGILALIVPLLELIKGLIYDAPRYRDPFGLFGDVIGDIYSRIFVQGFLFSIITYASSMALIVVILFLTANLLKINIGFMDITARFGAFMVIPTAIFILSRFVALLSLSSLSYYIGYFAMLAIAAAIIYTYNTFKAQGSKLDTYYIHVILLAASYLVYRIVNMILY